jgi:hypothetical protein
MFTRFAFWCLKLIIFLKNMSVCILENMLCPSLFVSFYCPCNKNGILNISSITQPCFQEHIDFDVVKSSSPEFKKATVRINIYRQHRQTIQVIDFYGLLLCNVFALHE